VIFDYIEQVWGFKAKTQNKTKQIKMERRYQRYIATTRINYGQRLLYADVIISKLPRHRRGREQTHNVKFDE
jgi:hypothetical protein